MLTVSGCQQIEIVLIRQCCSPRAYSRAKSSGRVQSRVKWRGLRKYLGKPVFCWRLDVRRVALDEDYMNINNYTANF